MSLGLVGRKVGMMRIFRDDGTSVPVTVIDCAGNRVAQIKTADVDGYVAIEAGSQLREFRVAPEAIGELKVGSELKVDMFQPGQKVDVSGTTHGKGFAGVIKRHHFSSNRASHGNSLSHNSPGSIGMAQDPGRVFPGKRMSGHLGNVKRTIQLLEIARVDAERSLLMVKGSIPGAKNGAVVVFPSVKAPAPKAAKGGK